MVKSYSGIGSMLFAFCLFIAGASAFSLNETVGDFSISFDAVYDASMMVSKMWSNESELVRQLAYNPYMMLNKSISGDDIESVVHLQVGNLPDYWDGDFGGFFILVLKNPENTSGFKRNLTQDDLFADAVNRTIDGRNGLFKSTRFKSTLKNNNSTMNTAIYWLDESQGTATKLVITVSTWPWDEGTKRLLDTIHVEEL